PACSRVSGIGHTGHPGRKVIADFGLPIADCAGVRGWIVYCGGVSPEPRMSLDKRTSKTASYPVAQGYRPPPLERKSSTPGWAFPVALGGVAAFLIVGVFLLVQCLRSEPEA